MLKAERHWRRSDKSPVIRECDKDATLTRQEPMSDVSQETQERDENNITHLLDEDSMKSWIEFWSKESENEVGQRIENRMSVLLGVKEVDVERANIWKCGMRWAVETRRKERGGEQEQNTGQEQGKQDKQVRFSQEEQQEGTKAESTGEPEVTGRLAEMRTGRGSSGLVRRRDEKCQADETSRKETAAAFPSRTVAAFPLTSTVQPSLDPLTVNDPWASAVAVRPVQQQHQTQVPFGPQLQGTEFWPQTGQPQQWSTPRSPFGLTGPPPTTLQGMSADDWQSPLPPPPTWEANAPGFGSGDGGRQDASLTGWNASGKGYEGGVMPFMEFSDRDPIPKWDLQEPGARLKPWLGELSFWRHDTSTPVNKQGVKLYKALPLGTIGRSLADQFSEDEICSGQGFDLTIGAIRHHFRSYLEAEPEVQAEIALYQSTRSSNGTFVEYTSRTSNKLREMERVVSKSFFRPN